MDTEVRRALVTLARAGIRVKQPNARKPYMLVRRDRNEWWRVRYTDWDGRSWRYNGCWQGDLAPSLADLWNGNPPLELQWSHDWDNGFRAWIASLGFPNCDRHVVKRGTIGPLGRLLPWGYTTHDWNATDPENDVTPTGSYSDCEISRFGLQQLRPNLLIYVVDRIRGYSP